MCKFPILPHPPTVLPSPRSSVGGGSLDTPKKRRISRRFALKIPVSRFIINSPAALGGIGATTGLFPALTLGCGAVGGSASSDNISPMHLINIRRVAWDTKLSVPENNNLVEIITAKILERLQ